MTKQCSGIWSSSTTYPDLGGPRRSSQLLIQAFGWSQDHPGPLIDPSLPTQPRLLLQALPSGLEGLNQSGFPARGGAEPELQLCFPARGVAAATPRPHVASPLMAIGCIAVGLHGDVLRVAIIQAALPQSITSFIFAKEYGLHAEVLSTAVIFGMLVSLPVLIAYYAVLEFVH